jgi:hypothetical protein
MRELFTGDNELRFGAFIGYLNDMQSNEFQFRHIWEITKHLYHYMNPEYTHPLCNVSRMQSDIKRAVKEGYLTTSGRKGGFKYIKTEKLLSTEFVSVQIK